MSDKVASLAKYTMLGRSGLRVSPLCLGTMTFGKEWGWGNTEEESHAILRRYLEAGGNFVDTANFYTGGTSEEMIGRYYATNGGRDRTVLATKFTLNMFPGDPNGGGNGRKNIMQSLEASLKRLKTDYVDLYWLHMWDSFTPAEEVMSALDALVRAGKVRYIGFSDVPAWYLAKAQTLAQWRGWEPLCALQLEYSLSIRDIEREHVPAALEFGLGITPWSPLAGGLLSGKYRRDKDGNVAVADGDKGRLTSQATPSKRFTERNWAIIDALHKVAEATGKHPAAIALNWVTKRPAVTSTIIGATSLKQLETNLSALEFDLSPEHAALLEGASAFAKGFPYDFLEPGGFVQTRVTGETHVAEHPVWYWPRA